MSHVPGSPNNLVSVYNRSRDTRWSSARVGNYSVGVWSHRHAGDLFCGERMLLHIAR